nr:NADH dehydrogenase subunit 6 [Ovalona pulchella]
MLLFYPLWFLLACLVLLFPYLSTPLSMGCCLLVTTLVMATALASIFSHLWLSYTLVLILLGGLLVIFIYVALVASNERFILNNKLYFLVFLLIPLIFSINDSSFNLTEQEQPITFFSQKLDWLNEIYSEEFYLFTMFLVLYLFLTLIVVVSNTKSDKMTLRSV